MAEALQKQKELNVRGRRFRLEEIRMVPTPDFRPTMTYRPFGQADFIVCRYQKDGKNYFRMPDDSEPGIPSCADLIAGNLRHKLLRLREIRPDIFENLMSIGGAGCRRGGCFADTGGISAADGGEGIPDAADPDQGNQRARFPRSFAHHRPGSRPPSGLGNRRWEHEFDGIRPDLRRAIICF